MNINYNWFFASFAQCSAALIAIIGAFIISKLIGETEKEEQSKNDIENLRIHYYDLMNRISGRYFDWYDRQNINFSGDLRKAIENGEFDDKQDDEMLIKLFEIEPQLFRTEDCLSILKKRIKKLEPEKVDLGIGFSMVNTKIDYSLPSKSIWDKLNQEKEAIDHLRIESETLIAKFTIAKNELLAKKKNLNPIRNTIYILAFGLILTVIYPLHFMPIAINEIPVIDFSLHNIYENIFSLKGLFLFSLTVVIEGIFIYFLWLINKTKRKINWTISQLGQEYFNIKSYSEYFE